MRPLLDRIVTYGSLDAAGILIVDSVIKSVVILTLAGVIAAVLRRTSAASRHMVWGLAVASLLVLPILSAFVPSWRAPVLPHLLTSAVPPASLQEYAGAAPFTLDVVPQQILLKQDGLRRTPSASSRSVVPEGIPTAFGWTGWIVTVWMGGAAILIARVAVSFIAVWQSGRLTVPVTEGGWTAVAGKLARQYGIRRRVVLRLASEATMPATWGFWRPTVLLPVEAMNWPQARIRAVLLHELAHVSRGDFAVQTLSRVACALYWFNPLVWIADRHLRRESEQASDDLVIHAGLTPSGYARQLVEVLAAAKREREVPSAALAMARRSELEGRVHAILDVNRSHCGLSPRRVATMTLAAICFVVALGIVRLEAQAHDVPKLERLPDGMKIELVGVSTHPSAAASWWGPDGKPLTKSPCDRPPEAVDAPGKIVRELVARITGLPEGSSLEWSTTQSNSRGIAAPKKDGKEVPDLHAIIAEFRSGLATCDVHFDLSLGDWSVAQAFDGKRSVGIQKEENEYFFGRAREIQGGTTIAIAHNITDCVVRVVAIDQNGRQHQPKNSSSGGSGHLRGLDVEFDLPAAQIREYQLQSRPVGRFEIKNVALQPRAPAE